MPSINDELQEGFHVAIFDFDYEQKLLMPPNFDIEVSGVDLRLRVVSLTRKQLVLKRAIKGNHLDSACAHKVIERSVYRRYRSMLENMRTYAIVSILNKFDIYSGAQHVFKGKYSMRLCQKRYEY